MLRKKCALLRSVAGKPVEIFVNMIELKFTKDDDVKTIMMEDYRRKDNLLKSWHNCKPDRNKFEEVHTDALRVAIIQITHAVLMLSLASYFDRISLLVKICFGLFTVITWGHTLGWIITGTSMESLPFETGIKAINIAFFGAKHKEA